MGQSALSMHGCNLNLEDFLTFVYQATTQRQHPAGSRSSNSSDSTNLSHNSWIQLFGICSSTRLHAPKARNRPSTCHSLSSSCLVCPDCRSWPDRRKEPGEASTQVSGRCGRRRREEEAGEEKWMHICLWPGAFKQDPRPFAACLKSGSHNMTLNLPFIV